MNFGHDGAPMQFVARYSCTDRTALEPSPTAAATRLSEPWRTSPTANTPGSDVSNGSGARAVYSVPAMIASGSERSVTMKPPRSSITQSPSHPVAGSAPMKQNSPEHGTVRAFAARRVLERHLGEVRSPASARTSVWRDDLDAVVRPRCARSSSATSFGERVASDHERHVAFLLRHVDRGLSGRVAAAHDDHVEAAADACLHVGCRVVHARAFEPFEVVDCQPPVASARRDDDGAGAGSRCRRRARSRESRARRAGRQLRTAH